MTFALRPVAAVCALGVAQGLFAQSISTVQLDPVMVTATRFETPLADSLASVSVITRETIEATQPAALADLLQREAGIEIGRNGGPGTVTSFFLRGAESKNVLILIDGMRTPTDSFGRPVEIDIAPEEIERIEVLRGNAGAYYGESAIGGVILITTRAATGGDQGRLEMGLGSRGTKQTNASLNRQMNQTNFGLTVGHKESTGLSAMDTQIKTLANPDADRYSQTFARFTLRQQATERLRWGMHLANTQASSEYDNSSTYFPVSQPSDTHQLTRSTFDLGVYANYDINANWRTSLNLGMQDLHQHDRINALPAPYNADIGSKQNRLEWRNTLATEAGIWQFGSEMAWLEGNNDGAQSSRITHAIQGGWTNDFGPVTVQTMLRRDLVQSTNAPLTERLRKTSGMLGLGYDLSTQWRLTATHSKGFRAPTSYEFQTTPTLQAESHDSNELGIAFKAKDAGVRLVAFQTRTANAIQYVYVPAGSSYYDNIKRTSNKGLELSGHLQWASTRLGLNWTHQDPRDANSHTLLLRRAKDYGSVDLSHRQGDTTWGAQWHISGKRNDSGGVVLAGYNTLDLSASHNVSKAWTLRGKIENLTDERYELVSGYNTPRRGVLVSLVYQAH